MWQVLPDLFLGDYGDARNRVRLQEHGITHIVNCSRELPCKFESDFSYLRLGLDDPDPDFAMKIPAFCSFINVGRQQGKVLVHCAMATSRSPAVVLAYLCHLTGSLQLAIDRLSQVVPTGIHESFLVQVGRHLGGEPAPDEVAVWQRRLLSGA